MTKSLSRLRSVKHLKFVASQPCIISGSTYGVQAHHLMKIGGRGMAMKASDAWVIPLHFTVHDALHRAGNEEVFFLNHGFNYDEIKLIAKGLCAISTCAAARAIVR